MIIDNLKNVKQYFALFGNLKKGFEFLLNSDLKNLPDGKHLIDGENIFANVQTLQTKPQSEAKWEAHRKYIDIQYVIKGQEKMGYGFLSDFKTTVIPYDEIKDVEFLDGEKYNFVDVEHGNFVIFYPNDVHAPMLAVNNCETIKKVIVKVKI